MAETSSLSLLVLLQSEYLLTIENKQPLPYYIARVHDEVHALFTPSPSY